MEDCVGFKHECTRGNSQSLLLPISDECLLPLKTCGYKLKFGLRYARVKVFQATSGDDVDETGGLLEDLQIEIQETEVDLKHSIHASDNLHIFVVEKDTDIVRIQEPCIRSSTVKISNKMIEGDPTACILVKKQLNSLFLFQLQFSRFGHCQIGAIRCVSGVYVHVS